MSASFDRWARTNRTDDTGYIDAYGPTETAYTAGLLGAAEIAEVMTDRIDIVHDGNTESIADAIRKEAGE